MIWMPRLNVPTDTCLHVEFKSGLQGAPVLIWWRRYPRSPKILHLHKSFHLAPMNVRGERRDKSSSFVTLRRITCVCVTEQKDRELSVKDRKREKVFECNRSAGNRIRKNELSENK